MLCIGAAVLDFIASVSEYPKENAKIRTSSHLITGGGNGANTATTIAKLGLPCAIISKVGADANGSLVSNELQGSGVTIDFLLADSSDTTAFTYVISSVTNATRTCIHTPLLMELSIEQIDDMNIDFTLYKHLHLDSRHTLAASHVSSLAKKHGICISIDAEKMKPHMDAVLPLCDIIFTNEHFPKLHATHRYGIYVPIHYQIPSDDLHDQMYSLLLQYSATIIITTLGSRGAVAIASSAVRAHATLPNTQLSKLQPLLQHLPVQASRQEYAAGVDIISISAWPMSAHEIVDTTGAGDAFIGGFLVGYASGYSLEECLQLATVTASEKLRGLGSRETLPDVHRIEEICRKMNRSGDI